MMPEPAPVPVATPATESPKGRLRTVHIVLICAAAVLVLAGAAGGIYVARTYGPLKDSGIAMCEQIRDAQDNGTTIKPGKGATDDKLTREEYQRIRGEFADSRHDDIREAGTKFTDLVWQFSSMTDDGDDSLGAALLLGGQMVQAYSSLSGACANHGVDLPRLGA